MHIINIGFDFEILPTRHRMLRVVADIIYGDFLSRKSANYLKYANNLSWTMHITNADGGHWCGFPDAVRRLGGIEMKCAGGHSHHRPATRLGSLVAHSVGARSTDRSTDRSIPKRADGPAILHRMWSGLSPAFHFYPVRIDFAFAKTSIYFVRVLFGGFIKLLPMCLMGILFVTD